MNKLSRYNCSLCKKPIIGIKGQDLVLDTYLLSESIEDKRILEKGIFGSVHIKCLLNDYSNYNFWHKKLSEHYLNGSFYECNDDILINKNSLEIMSFEENQIFSLRNIEILSINQIENTILIRDEINVDLTSLKNNDIIRLTKKLKDENQSYLSELIDLIKINELIINPIILSNAIIKPFDNDKDETFYNLKESFFSGICEYKILVSNSFLSCLYKLNETKLI